MRNWDEYQYYLELAKEGQGLHHNARGFSITEFPRISNQDWYPRDLEAYVMPEELVKYVPDLQIPPRYSFLAVDAR